MCERACAVTRDGKAPVTRLFCPLYRHCTILYFVLVVYSAICPFSERVRARFSFKTPSDNEPVLVCRLPKRIEVKYKVGFSLLSVP